MTEGTEDEKFIMTLPNWRLTEHSTIFKIFSELLQYSSI